MLQGVGVKCSQSTTHVAISPPPQPHPSKPIAPPAGKQRQSLPAPAQCPSQFTPCARREPPPKPRILIASAPSRQPVPNPLPSARPGKEPLVPNARGSPSRWQRATHTLDGAVRRELAISRIDNYCHLSCPLFASPHLRCSCARHSRGMEPACVVVRSSSYRTNASRWEMWTSDRRGRHKTPDIASLRDCRRWKSVRFSCCR